MSFWQVGVAPSLPCHTFVLLPQNSWDHKLSADVLFASVLATVQSKYWKKLDEIFFWNDITLRRLWKLYHYEKKSQAFFNILTEPLLVQKQTIHQQKAWDLRYLEPGRKGRGMVRRVPRPLVAKDIEKKSKFDGAKSGHKKKFISIYFLLCLWYELSACPLLLNANKVYFLSSLIARPNVTFHAKVWIQSVIG